MIDKVEITNFQSHLDTLLKFHPGINAIIGKSNHGKTAIIRALKWAIRNQPGGNGFVSHWAKSEKGNLVDSTEVTVFKGKNSLTRFRNSTDNGYTINKKQFTALGKSGLPEEVVSFFGMNEINLQFQMDPPFLIGSTPEQVAKFLNEIIDLSDIGIYLSAAESKKRETNKEIKIVSQDIKEVEEDLQNFHGLEDLENLFERLQKITSMKARKAIEKEKLENLLLDHQKTTALLDKSKGLGDLIKVHGKLKNIVLEKDKILKEQKHLGSQVEKMLKAQETLSRIPSIETLNLKKFKEFLQEKEGLVSRMDKLQRLEDFYREKITEAETTMAMIRELNSKIPERCPTCGSALKKGNHRGNH
jgi:exonuclease SbcC